MNKIEKYHQSKAIKLATYACVALIVLFAVVTFSQYYSTKLNLTNPLIPEYLVQMSIKPYLIKGAILITGILGIFALIFYKKNLFGFALAIFLIIYYIFSNHSIGGWHFQL